VRRPSTLIFLRERKWGEMRFILTTVLAYLFGVNIQIDGRPYGPPKPRWDRPSGASENLGGAEADGLSETIREPAATLARR
jgi:hypothetical protein